jgi:hypothetical protein
MAAARHRSGPHNGRSSGPGLPSRRRAARSSRAPSEHTPSPAACLAGLPFFSAQILQHIDVHRLLGHDLLQSRVLPLQLLQPRDFGPLHAAVLVALTMQRLLAHLQLAPNLGERTPLAQLHFHGRSFSKICCGVCFLRFIESPSRPLGPVRLSSHMVRFQGVRSQ